MTSDEQKRDDHQKYHGRNNQRGLTGLIMGAALGTITRAQLGLGAGAIIGLLFGLVAGPLVGLVVAWVGGEKGGVSTGAYIGLER